MSTFVLEIGTEELPARFLSNVEKELAESVRGWASRRSWLYVFPP